MKELKVGERITLEVVESPLCTGCNLFGNITLDGYPTATYSIDELKILKNLLTQVLGEVDEYMSLKDKGACV